MVVLDNCFILLFFVVGTATSTNFKSGDSTLILPQFIIIKCIKSLDVQNQIPSYSPQISLYLDE